MNPRGFTLLELLVALAVFTVIGVAAYTGLFAVLDARDATRSESERLAAVQYAVDTFVDDLVQATDRSVRSVQPRERAPLYAPGPDAEPLLAVTRGGWPNPARLPRSTLGRVEWFLDERQLVRQTRARPDAPDQVEPVRRRLLERVEAATLRFRDADGEWSPRWPPLNAPDTAATLPHAVEVTLELTDWGEIRRLVALPRGEGIRSPVPADATGGEGAQE
ncbi:MAG: type II secretion system minor pseudopilin GspJ [Halofilum sp. (in: g-proteobacteria)]